MHQQLIELANANVSIRQIAKRLSLPPDDVSLILRDYRKAEKRARRVAVSVDRWLTRALRSTLPVIQDEHTREWLPKSVHVREQTGRGLHFGPDGLPDPAFRASEEG